MKWVFVDLETGTILNGPVVEMPSNLLNDDMSDAEVIAAAIKYISRELKWDIDQMY